MTYRLRAQRQILVEDSDSETETDLESDSDSENEGVGMWNGRVWKFEHRNKTKEKAGWVSTIEQ